MVIRKYIYSNEIIQKWYLYPGKVLTLTDRNGNDRKFKIIALYPYHVQLQDLKIKTMYSPCYSTINALLKGAERLEYW